ncbi:hypothetical protein [Candidatus Amarolinea aalborgensis]|jgi:hypothetical protein|uniref:hypothetical protein n=1 Tax=Candidatus Amarolinea aalborgensis TaxID=2249329 RepID=UPI003BF9F7F2
MQVYTNQKYIQRRATIGKWTTGVALVVLLAGSIISFMSNTALLPVALACLLLGFVGANVGSFYMRRFVRKPRPDEVIASSLKGLDDRYEFFAWHLPAPNVLLCPAGLFVFVTRDQEGKITVTKNNWKQPFSIVRLFTAFSQEALGNPAREVMEEVGRVKQWIKQVKPDLEIEPQPVVVFVSNKTELTLNDASVPVIFAKDLKDYLRKQIQAKTGRMTEPARKQLSQMFTSAEAKR